MFKTLDEIRKNLSPEGLIKGNVEVTFFTYYYTLLHNAEESMNDVLGEHLVGKFGGCLEDVSYNIKKRDEERNILIIEVSGFFNFEKMSVMEGM